MKIRSVFLLFLLLVFIFVNNNYSSEVFDPDESILSHIYSYDYDRFIDYPEDNKIKSIGKKLDMYHFDWEFNYTLFNKDELKEGFNFDTKIFLNDYDTFYGREDFPEAKNSSLFKGNNYNLTFNNNDLKSDNYIYRQGHIRGLLDIIYFKNFENSFLKLNFEIQTGENFERGDFSAGFNNIEYSYNDDFNFQIGEINPYFNDFLLDKQNTELTGFMLKKSLNGFKIQFVAARPDIPLDFTDSNTEEVSFNMDNWNVEKPIIFHFPEPYNYFDLKKEDIPVSVSAYSGDNFFNITDVCEITHSDVIVPVGVINEGYDRIVINYDSVEDTRQLMYLNAFKIDKSFLGLNFALSYVDLHNDTHSIENVGDYINPFDSNIWSFNINGEKGVFNFDLFGAQSKMIPDDYEYEKREVDFLYSLNAGLDFVNFDLNVGYTWFGADYILNIIDLKHKWKLVEDSNSDFKWDYENSVGKPGNEIYKLKINHFIPLESEVSLFYIKDLKSNYKSNEEYASYNKFYLPYFSASGNDFNLYGEGIDDNKKTLKLNYEMRFHNLDFIFGYEKVKDDNLMITSLKKDYTIRNHKLKYTHDYFDLSLDYIHKKDFVYYSPDINNFKLQKEDNTLDLKFKYHRRIKITENIFIKLFGKINYIKDADSLYLNKEWYFKNYIVENMDFVDENIFKHRGGLNFYYKFSKESYFHIFYDAELLSGKDSVNDKTMDYKRIKRGIKYYTNFKNENVFLVAFYDEDLMQFEKLEENDFSYKRIGAFLKFKF